MGDLLRAERRTGAFVLPFFFGRTRVVGSAPFSAAPPRTCFVGPPAPLLHFLLPFLLLATRDSDENARRYTAQATARQAAMTSRSSAATTAVLLAVALP